MLTRRIIPCLDVRDGKVVKGVRFRDHLVVGEIVDLAKRYAEEGADELVFYDITASADRRSVDTQWVSRVASVIDIPFCVAGGIRSLEHAVAVLNSGADKISINSPALESPELVSALAARFGVQCVVVGVDSLRVGKKFEICQYTGDPSKTRRVGRRTVDWVREVVDRGAGEVVLNCMDRDGTGDGFDLEHCVQVRKACAAPLVISGGAGNMDHFVDALACADAALAAGIFHRGEVRIPDLKTYLDERGVAVRPVPAGGPSSADSSV